MCFLIIFLKKFPLCSKFKNWSKEEHAGENNTVLDISSLISNKIFFIAISIFLHFSHTIILFNCLKISSVDSPIK